jgi:hypothetical protein
MKKKGRREGRKEGRNRGTNDENYLTVLLLSTASEIFLRHANVLVPAIFIEQLPQIP